MKKLCLLASLVLLLSLTGCNSKKVDQSSTQVAENTCTKDDLIKIFNSDTSHAKDKVIDCVVVSDPALKLLGAIQYMDEHDNPCNFDFITKEGICIPSGFPTYSGVSESQDLSLAYLGNGTFTCSLIENESLQTKQCYIQYKNKYEDSKINFN